MRLEQRAASVQKTAVRMPSNTLTSDTPRASPRAAARALGQAKYPLDCRDAAKRRVPVRFERQTTSERPNIETMLRKLWSLLESVQHDAPLFSAAHHIGFPSAALSGVRSRIPRMRR
jgi:hypothetical protein